MRRGILMMEAMVGLAVLSFILASSVIFAAVVSRSNLEVRREAAAVQALSNLAERIRARPEIVPAPGRKTAVELPIEIAERYPGLTLQMSAREFPDRPGLRRVRLAANLKNDVGGDRQTALDLIVRVEAKKP